MAMRYLRCTRKATRASTCAISPMKRCRATRISSASRTSAPRQMRPRTIALRWPLTRYVVGKGCYRLIHAVSGVRATLQRFSAHRSALRSIWLPKVLNFLETGTIKNSVNFPAASLDRQDAEHARLCIVNYNKPGACHGAIVQHATPIQIYRTFYCRFP